MGCTVSFFGWKGKLKAGNIWTAFPAVASAFLELCQICHKRHFRRLSNLLCSCMKRTVQCQQWIQQGKSCSPNSAKLFFQQCKAIENIPPYRGCSLSAHSSCSQSSLFGASVSTEHQGCHLHLPGDGPRTKDNHGSHCGQRFARLSTHVMSWSTVAANKTVKQDTNWGLKIHQTFTTDIVQFIYQKSRNE